MKLPETPNGGTGEQQLPEATALAVNLTTNPQLNHFLDALRTSEFDWARIKQIYNNVTTRMGRAPFKQFEHLLGFFVEIQLHLALAKYLNEYGEIVEVDPIQSGAKTDRFTFYRDRAGGLYAKEFRKMPNGKSMWHDTAEYDMIVVAGGLPVVIESKMTQRKSFGWMQVRRAVEPRTINQKLEPLREYFHADTCGYVILTSPEAITQNPRLVRFQEQGGLIHPLAISYDDFLQSSIALTSEVAPHIQINHHSAS